MIIQDRDIRQRGIVPPEKLKDIRATVVGVGAIGRQVALQLTAIGVPRIQLIDFDSVEPANLAAQGYLEKDLGRLKVEATASLCRQINSETHLNLHPERFRRTMEVGNVVFCCVDSISTRKLIWEAVQHRVQLFIDGRMSAEVIRVLAATDDASRHHYPTTLFAQSEAFSGSCTARATIFTANVAAGLMVGQFTKWLRGLCVERDLTINLLSLELVT